jgi:CubicO group peptidase (beta-lactamase class C family)
MDRLVRRHQNIPVVQVLHDQKPGEKYNAISSPLPQVLIGKSMLHWAQAFSLLWLVPVRGLFMAILGVEENRHRKLLPHYRVIVRKSVLFLTNFNDRGMLAMRLIFLVLSIFLASAGTCDEVYRQPAGIADLKSPFIAAGYNALFTCSAHFVAGRPLADIKEVELADTLPLNLADPIINESLQTVSVQFEKGPARIAAFRQGMGCTLLPPHWAAADIPRLPYVQYSANPEASELPWPMGDKYSVLEPQSLTDILDRAFDSVSYGKGTLTASVIILKDGEVIAERYRVGFGPYSGYRTWSTAKSISASLIGIAAKKGLLNLNEPAPIPEWQHSDDPRSEILLKELMWMSSGLFGGGSNTAAVYFGGQDVVSAVTSTQLEVDPGTRWKYANNDTLLSLRALKHRLGDNLAYLRFPYDELLHKIGMYHTTMETDHLGNFIGSSQVYTTSRDLARFGLLLDNDGIWQNERILPEGWVEFIRTPAPARPIEPGEQGYGAQFWLFGTMYGLPDNTFSSAGNKGQFVTVVPDQNLVVVRTGVDPAGHRWNQPAFTAEILKQL